MSRTLRTITVAELLEALSDQDPQARVIFSADYGDRGQTQQALGLRGDVDSVFVSESAYSDSGFAVSEDDADDDGQAAFVRIS